VSPALRCQYLLPTSTADSGGNVFDGYPHGLGRPAHTAVPVAGRADRLRRRYVDRRPPGLTTAQLCEPAAAEAREPGALHPPLGGRGKADGEHRNDDDLSLHEQRVGYISWAGWHIRSIHPYWAGPGVKAFAVSSISAPTRYKTSAASRESHLAGGAITYALTLSPGKFLRVTAKEQVRK
jgi:hypothetical protein